MTSTGADKTLVWITGANGLIGNYLVQTAPRFAPRWRVRALTRADFDLLDFAAAEHAFAKDKPQIIIHCAAITTVGEAQKNPIFARRVNVEVTQFLAELAQDIPFVFFSTDLVFDGRKGNYSETDAPNSLHVYGETKLAAEAVVLKNPRHLVVRTSINGGMSPSGNRAFNEQLRRSLREAGQGMTLFTDEFRNPIPAVETARAVLDLVGKNCAGIHHVAGADVTALATMRAVWVACASDWMTCESPRTRIAFATQNGWQSRFCARSFSNTGACVRRAVSISRSNT